MTSTDEDADENEDELLETSLTAVSIPGVKYAEPAKRQYGRRRPSQRPTPPSRVPTSDSRTALLSQSSSAQFSTLVQQPQQLQRRVTSNDDEDDDESCLRVLRHFVRVQIRKLLRIKEKVAGNAHWFLPTNMIHQKLTHNLFMACINVRFSINIVEQMFLFPILEGAIEG